MRPPVAGGRQIGFPLEETLLCFCSEACLQSSEMPAPFGNISFLSHSKLGCCFYAKHHKLARTSLCASKCLFWTLGQQNSTSKMKALKKAGGEFTYISCVPPTGLLEGSLALPIPPHRTPGQSTPTSCVPATGPLEGSPALPLSPPQDPWVVRSYFLCPHHRTEHDFIYLFTTLVLHPKAVPGT